MKKFVLALIALLTLTASARAMSYEQAREQALFLTDKMAYELNLTDDQYEAAYEINLDYLLSIDDYNDLYGTYWQQRNLDLSYILLDWQYQSYLAASYFYRPLYWSSGYWHFGIYARYPRRDYFYFGRPSFVTVYRGGHSWRVNGGRSWYHGRTFGQAPGRREYFGMRDGFNRGDYGRGYSRGDFDRNNRYGNRTYDYRSYDNRSYDNRSYDNRASGARSNGTFSPRDGRFSPRDNHNDSYTDNRRTYNFGNRGNGSFENRQSSTRTTVTRPGAIERGVFGGNRFNSDRSNSVPSPSFTPRASGDRGNLNNSRGSFGGNQGSIGSARSGGSFGGGSFGSSHSRGSFGTRR
ncbi:hypothetical protein JHU38_03810 [Prevotella sp. A2931]|uniref:DUF3300 domain-containing protein n=1 Tax=Prevotella illustrans TaxID=2800387 RepID=A0ABS3M426_9BACT|nr:MULTISPECIES: hypothetical protein [Prevotella]MBO1362909.1 hypothetical protein [Prevotella illustrans]PTL27182.1 hypothetical protein C3V39_09250 [Prevotella sp. oral taxon 820]